ncbi:hypothetical protein IFM89_010364 [Coptis chinensis]|uniref:NTF2 domain-containing protein n=1 Tax=Coptis chinensis TaxID=261450 RepID=A0A835LQY0_9MAGN|nr:hypothetical protein IFM89_010364 [Coptis chinensis]
MATQASNPTALIPAPMDINVVILSMDYKECKAEIKTIDAQDSYKGGVVVQVTGWLIVKDNVKRMFTQSFFLAPQDKGYFVLNDIFSTGCLTFCFCLTFVFAMSRLCPGICKLPSFKNFTFSYNFFNGEANECVPSTKSDIFVDDISNCLPDRLRQKEAKTCSAVVNKPVDCASKCSSASRPSLPSPSPKPSTPKPQPELYLFPYSWL